MRKLDGKFHLEGEKIIKTSNGEELNLEKEPIFIFRARDKFTLPILWIYLQLCRAENCTEYQILGIKDQIDKFSSFVSENSIEMKQPGITKGL